MGKDRTGDMTRQLRNEGKEMKARIERREPDEDRNRFVNPDSGHHAPAGGLRPGGRKRAPA